MILSLAGFSRCFSSDVCESVLDKDFHRIRFTEASLDFSVPENAYDCGQDL
jgi:hypothetical protein